MSHKQTPSELGQFIQKHLKSLDMTQTELAKRLGVNRSSVSRILNGSTQYIRRVDSESLCEALELNVKDRQDFHMLVKEMQEMNRRSFLEKAGKAVVTSFAFSVGVPHLIKYRTNLDLAKDHVNWLERRLGEGDKPEAIMKSASLWYRKLTEEAPQTKEQPLAEVQIQFGLLLGNAQSLALPLDQRAAAAIPTFNAVNAIIDNFGLHTFFMREYAQLLAHRGVHYRGLGLIQQSDDDYKFGIDLAERSEDPLLRVTLLRLLAHNRAVRGEEDAWSRQLDEGERASSRLSPPYRAGALAHLAYVRAGGYRRLAFNTRLNLPRSIRIAYAEKALTSAARSYEAIERDPESSRLLLQTVDERNPRAHYLTAQVADAQCFILLDPEETIRRIEHLWDEVMKFYPSLLPRMRQTLRIAQGQLQKPRINPLLLFGLDARPGC